MKVNQEKNQPFFTAEVKGLAAAAKTGAIGTPHVMGSGSGRGKAFLLMGFAEGRKPAGGYWEIFARQLAGMHQAPVSDFILGGRFGSAQDNYIGASRQICCTEICGRAYLSSVKRAVREYAL